MCDIPAGDGAHAPSVPQQLGLFVSLSSAATSALLGHAAVACDGGTNLVLVISAALIPWFDHPGAIAGNIIVCCTLAIFTARPLRRWLGSELTVACWGLPVVAFMLGAMAALLTHAHKYCGL